MKRILIIVSAAAVICSCGSARKAAVTQASENPQRDSINVGYQTVDAESLTYSVTQVRTKENELLGYSTIWDYLRSRVPGLIIGPASVGTTPEIRIRGVGSVNSSNDPLILLDGQETADISWLNPMDVASVSVLKDASAAIYGTRGANGVILITTKSARDIVEAEAAAKKAARQAAREARKK